LSPNKIKKATVFVAILSLSSILGCDQVSYFKDYFTSGEHKQKSVATTPKSSSGSPKNVAQQAQWTPNTLAQVGNWTITIEEFNQRLSNLKQAVPSFDIGSTEAKKQILEELIRQQLLLIDAENTGLAKRKDIVEAVEEFRKTVLIREMATKIAEGTGEVTTLEAQDYYNENKEFIVDPPEWRVKEIVTETEDGAKEILIELLKGTDFSEMAINRSTAESKRNGGELDLFVQPPFVEMGNQLISMESGDVSRVFKGPQGYYIIKLEEKVGGEPKDFVKIKDEIITGLTIIKQQQALVDYIDSLKQKTKIKTNEQLLSSNASDHRQKIRLPKQIRVR